MSDCESTMYEDNLVNEPNMTPASRLVNRAVARGSQNVSQKIYRVSCSSCLASISGWKEVRYCHLNFVSRTVCCYVEVCVERPRRRQWVEGAKWHSIIKHLLLPLIRKREKKDWDHWHKRWDVKIVFLFTLHLRLRSIELSFDYFMIHVCFSFCLLFTDTSQLLLALFMSSSRYFWHQWEMIRRVYERWWRW